MPIHKQLPVDSENMQTEYTLSTEFKKKTKFCRFIQLCPFITVLQLPKNSEISTNFTNCDKNLRMSFYHQLLVLQSGKQMTTQDTGLKKHRCIYHLDVPLLFKQTSTYIFRKHTQRQKISGKYTEKNKTHPGGLITHLHCLLHNTQVRTRCDKQVYTQLKPPKASNPIIAVVIAFNQSLATPTIPQCMAERIFPSESRSLVHVCKLYRPGHFILVLIVLIFLLLMLSSVCLSDIVDLTTADSLASFTTIRDGCL